MINKPKRRGRGPAKVYEKSRSSQQLEDRKNPPKVTEATDIEDDEDEEMQVHDELEPEQSELTSIPAYLATGEDPESYKQAIHSVDHDEWQAAMQAEMDSIVSVGTFELVPPPRDHKPIGCKWVFRVRRARLRPSVLTSKTHLFLMTLRPLGRGTSS